MNTAHMSKYF